MSLPQIYNRYTVNEVFTDKSVNVICNQIMQFLQDEFPNLNSLFALSGHAGECYLNSAIGPVENVMFKTTDRALYVKIGSDLKKVTPLIKGLGTFEEKIVAYYPSAIFEFYLVDELEKLQDLKGIYVCQ